MLPRGTHEKLHEGFEMRVSFRLKACTVRVWLIQADFIVVWFLLCLDQIIIRCEYTFASRRLQQTVPFETTKLFVAEQPSFAQNNAR